MSERQNIPDLTPQYDEYSLASLLQEYARKNRERTETAAPVQETLEPQPASAAEPAPAPAADYHAESAETIAERSRRAAMASLGEALRHYQSGADREPEPGASPEPEETDNTPPETEDRPRFSVGEDGVITLRYAQEEPDRPRMRFASSPNEEPEALPPEEEPAGDDESSDEPSHPRRRTSESRTPRLSFRERFLAPAVRMIATRLARRQMQTAEAANWPEPLDIRETPELSPRKAAKYYASLLRPLTLRLRISLALTLILAWISLRLPMTGMLSRSVALQAGVSLALLLAVMITALDVVTAGLRQLFDCKPGAEALASVAALLSGVDAALVLFGQGDALPFCAIGAASLTAALWGEQLTCRALRRTFKTAAASHTPSVLTTGAVADPAQQDAESPGLLRSERDSVEGIVRRSESQDLCRTAYAAAAPFLLAAALVLSILASLGGNGSAFLHTLSALVSVSASFAAFFAFPLPYAIASRKLRSSGAALAGYDGCADIGKNRRIVITDEDLFPPGTMKFTEINVAEGVFLGKVVSSTAALLAASGSGVSALFDELVARRGYNIPPVEDFVCHEGGGLSGLVRGEQVLVGSAGFMNLMGIRLPQNLQTANSICAAISGELVGVFVVDYIPVTSVQDALVMLMRGRTQTVFAIRDFNITPRMIGRLFRMPTDNFNFPSFRERYRIVGASSGEGPVDAVISRAGMLPLVEAAEAGRKAYSTCRISTILSLVGAVIGMIIMFLLCRAGAFDTASAGNVLSFMALWSLPALILSLGQNR